MLEHTPPMLAMPASGTRCSPASQLAQLQRLLWTDCTLPAGLPGWVWCTERL